MSAIKIVCAAAIRVEELRPEVNTVLRYIAQLLKECDESEGDWLDYVFVSDESRLGDFISSDLELQALRSHLAIPELDTRDTICAIAFALRKNRATQTIP